MLKSLYKVVVRLFTGLGLLVTLVTFTPLDSWWANKLAAPWGEPQGEVLIVLGGSPSNDGVIGQSSYLRSQYAVYAYRRGGFRSVVLTGGGVPTSVATAMRDFISCQGVPASVILTETTSDSTRENALFSRPLLANLPGQKVLLTSDYHIWRARRVFRKLGMDVAPMPIPDVRKRAERCRGRWPAFLDLLEESVKIAYYYTRGWI
jgi:uncharacterized SAM-binding protein YcdF (DUF218 family)